MNMAALTPRPRANFPNEQIRTALFCAATLIKSA